MRILYINHYRRFKLWRWGRFYALAAALAKRGHEVTVCLVADTARFRMQSYRQDGVQFHAFPDLLTGRMRSGWDLWCALRRGCFLRKFGPVDVVHCFESRPATIYPVLANRRRLGGSLFMDWNDWWGRGGLVVENRPHWYAATMGRIETYYEEAFRKYADGHTVVSDALADRLVSLGARRDRVLRLPNGSEPCFFQPINKQEARKAMGLPLDVPILFFSGYEVLYDRDLALEAFRLFRREYPQALLLLTGGSGGETVKAFVRKHGLESAVIQTGYLNDQMFRQAIAAGDVCLMPFRDRIANRARFPGKVAEYLSMGKTVVTNPVGEMKKLFADEQMGLLADESAGAMAAKMTLLIKNQALRERMELAARRYAENDLSWSALAARLEVFYGVI